MKANRFHSKKFLGYVRSTVAAVMSATVLMLSFSGCSSVGNQIKDQIGSLSSSVESGASSWEQQTSSGVPSSLPSVSSPVSSPRRAVSSGGAPTAAVKSSVPGKTDVLTVKKLSFSLAAGTAQKKTVAAAVAPKAGYTAVQQHNSYQNLTAVEKNLYSAIGGSVHQIAVQKNTSGYYPTAFAAVSGNLSEAQIRLSLIAYMDDNPQVFWLANAYAYEYLNGTTVVQLYSELSPDECNSSIQMLNGIVSSVVKSIPSGLDEFDREEYLFDYIADHCSYDNAAVTDTGRWQSFTAVGPLVKGTAVCEGYSRAMQLLAGDVGITCSLVRGSSDGVGHMWNAIRISGNWYNLDTTWSDNTILIYNYFNIPDSVLKQTHMIGSQAGTLSDSQICSDTEQFNIFLPACTSVSENYFKVRGISIAGLEKSSTGAVQSLASQMKAGKTSIGFLINASSDYDSAVQGFLSGSLSSLLTDAAREAGKTLDRGNIKYVTDKADSGLTLSVSYQ